MIVIRLLVVALVVMCDVVWSDDGLRSITIPKNAIEARLKVHRFEPVVSGKSYSMGGVEVGQRVYYENGQLAEERLLQDGKLHGYRRQWHENGMLFSEQPYREGVLDGTCKYWSPGGNLLGESLLTKGTGVLREFPNDALRVEDQEIPYVKGKIEGVKKVWERTEVTSFSLIEYRNGLADGWSVGIDKEGRVHTSYSCRRDRIHGVYRKFKPDGTLLPDYPEYWVMGDPASEAEFKAACKKDEALRRSLTDDGRNWPAIKEFVKQLRANGR